MSDKGEVIKEYIKEEIKKAAREKLKFGIIVVLAVLILPLFIIMVTASGDIEERESGYIYQMNGTSGTTWEQYLRYVREMEGGATHVEGEYYLVHDDGYGNPTIGNGLCLYADGTYMHVEEFAQYGIDSKAMADAFSGKVLISICDEIWSSHLAGIYENVVADYSDLHLTEYQVYALTDVRYRRGNTNGFEEKFKQYWKEDYNTEYFKEYDLNGVDSFENLKANPQLDTLYSFFHNGFTDTTSGVYRRKVNQWVLFKYGYYREIQDENGASAPGEYWAGNLEKTGENSGTSGSGVPGAGEAAAFWWPIEAGSNGKPKTTYISSGYSNRTLNGETGMHYGIDITGGNSPKIIATYDGYVYFAGDGSYGTCVYLRHTYNGQTYYSIYGHMVAGSLQVREGQNIKAGTVLGTMGSTGYSTGVHLHFEIRKNSMDANTRAANNINPLSFVDPNNPYPQL